MIRIIESPREGMQGFSRIIPTDEKVRFIDRLLRVGFDTLDIGSMVSPRIIPQMADTLDVLNKLDFSTTSSNRMILVVNTRGAELLAGLDCITHISYPSAFSPAFLKLNVNSSLDKSLETIKNVILICNDRGKQAVIYISMAFGNPYGDPWNLDLLVEWVTRLIQAGATIIPLSNVSMEIDPELVAKVYSLLIPMFPEVEFGLHLHTTNQGWHDILDAAYTAGCRCFDSVINGRGGCPMAGKEMLGNLNTEDLLAFAQEKECLPAIDHAALKDAMKIADDVYE